MDKRTTLAEVLANGDNTIRTYYNLDKSMIQDHQAGKYKEAEKTARTLLENADLPLILRARACQNIGCGTSSDFFEMAKEGLRVAELLPSRCTDPGDVEKGVLEECKEVLKEAQKESDNLKKEGKGRKRTKSDGNGEAAGASAKSAIQEREVQEQAQAEDE